MTATQIIVDCAELSVFDVGYILLNLAVCISP